MLRFLKNNFVNFKKKYKFIILIFLLIYFLCNLLTISLSQDDEEIKLILSPENLVKKVVIGEYTFRCYIGPPPFRNNVFQIYKGEELVYQSKVGHAYWLGKKEGLFHPGDDITGDGIPNLVVMYSSGGNSSFNQFCYVFSLGDQFRLIQYLPEGNFVDINQDGKLDCIAYQPGFTFWHACHAGSPVPKIVYEYCDNEYLLAPALMYQPLPEEEEINKTIEEVKRRCAKTKEEKWDHLCWHYEEVYLDSSVWSYMLKLMFSGHSDEAYDFLDKVWPEGEKGKSYFIYDFEKLLNETTWPALEPIFDRIAEVKKEKPSASLEEEILKGTIRIWAYPENTKVYINNEYLGEAPLSTKLLAPGGYNIRLSHLGYHDSYITTNVVPLHIRQVEGSLKQKEGNSTLFVTSNPEKAEVCLDNTYIGLTPLKIKKIPPGENSLAFIKSDYHLYKEIIQIYPGEDHKITVDLQPKVQERTLFEEYPFIEEKLFLIGLVIFSFVVLFFKDL